MILDSIRLRSRFPVGSALGASALALSLALAACSAQPAPTAQPASAPAAQTTTSPSADSSGRVASAPTTSAGTTGSAATGAAQKVNANTASQDDVARVLTANGVPNGARWAREVVEYRPYPTDDPSFAKLRQELAKYNPSPEVVDQIIAALSL